MKTRRQLFKSLLCMIPIPFVLKGLGKVTSTYKRMTREQVRAEGLGILADDTVRQAFIEECKRQNEWKDAVDRTVESNRLWRRDAESEAFRKYYDETEINALPVYVGESNNKFYDLFTDNEGNLIDGTEIRPFLDWTPLMPDKPRWAGVKFVDFAGRGDARGNRLGQLTTYLDSELHPVEDSMWDGNPNRAYPLSHNKRVIMDRREATSA